MAARISAAGSAYEVEPDSEGKRQFLDSIDGAGGEVTDDDLQENKGSHGEAGPDEHGLDRCQLEPPQSRRSEEHTSELQSLMRISYAVFCVKKKKIKMHTRTE